MPADLGGLLDDANVEIAVELLEPHRARKAGRARANDNDVVFHDLAFGHTRDSIRLN